MKALFIADWMDVAFLHFRVDPASLAAQVPMEIDLHDGQAYVTLVAFTQRRLRPAIGGNRVGRLAGQLTEWLSAPLASHEFLNVRTYVRHGEQRGIFFLAEWIPNRLAAFIGPRTYGLPYRLGRLDYRSGRRTISADGNRLSFDIITDISTVISAPTQAPCIREDGGKEDVDQFLLERYTAYTHRNGVTRRFDVQHDPWLQARVQVNLTATGLLPVSGDWWHGGHYNGAEFSHANYSAGVNDVRISTPRIERLDVEAVNA